MTISLKIAVYFVYIVRHLTFSDILKTELDLVVMHKKTKLFLCFQVLADEFSHTVLHRQPFVVPGPKAVQGRPVKPTAGKLQYIS